MIVGCQSIASTQPSNSGLDRLGDELYERYGKPLEAEHWGEFLSVVPDGRRLIGKDLTEVAHAAVQAFGHGIRLYKIGPRAVGRL